jgi:DnaD/phage-associated family protein
LAESLNILESDIDNAWKYWEKQGLVRIDSDGGQMDIEFLPVPARQKKTPQLMTEKPQQKRTPVLESPVPLRTKPQYTPEELEIYQNQSSEIKKLFKFAERIMGKLLSYNDLNVIFGFYDWLRLPLDEIHFLFEYCAENDHRDLRYIEAVAVSWAEKEINTLAKAQEYTQQYGKNFRDIVRALGGRSLPSPTQKRFIDTWIQTLKMPPEVILEACDISAIRTGRSEIKYVNSILEDWAAKDIHTLDSAKAEAAKHLTDGNGSQAKASVPQPRRPEKKNRFVNFNQRDVNFAELERLEQEQLKQIMKG